ncbi:MAG: hypothetical protein H0V89_07805 [Deltaproteobacteria bacterium]|nr:hypothetical protein [Deltaproteobacteria bacterium]
MANVTLKIDDAVLLRARVRALELGTSVNAVITDYIERFAGELTAQQSALSAILAQADDQNAEADARAAARGQRAWTRDDLHER